MVLTSADIASAIVEATFLARRKSVAASAVFRRDMDQTRQTIAASRALLERLRQASERRTRTAPISVCAYDADIIRKVFRELVLETGVPECQWRDLAKSLVFEFTECERVEAGLLDWVISKSGATQP
jgi:hypothetical protein